MVLLEDYVKDLQDIDDAIVLLRKNGPSIHEVDNLKANIVETLNKSIAGKGESEQIATILRTDVLQRKGGFV